MPWDASHGSYRRLLGRMFRVLGRCLSSSSSSSSSSSYSSASSSSAESIHTNFEAALNFEKIQPETSKDSKRDAQGS